MPVRVVLEANEKEKAQFLSWAMLEQKAKNRCMRREMSEMKPLKDQQIKTRSALENIRHQGFTNYPRKALDFCKKGSSSHLYVKLKEWVARLTSEFACKQF